MTAIQSDHKEDGGQMSILRGFRNMGPYGLPVAALFAAIIFLWAIEPPDSYNAPSLNVALYFIFSLLMPLLIIFLVSRSFFITGEPGLLMLGCGVVIWSCAGVPALVLAKSDPNITFTIYNLCLWMSGLCHLVGAGVSLRSRPRIRSAGVWLAGAYIGALCCVGLVIYSALAGWTPPFFIKGQGSTLLRQWVLGSAVVMFALSAALLKAPGRRPSVLLNWYALALLLIASGIIGFMLQSSKVNDLQTWASRSALFLSGAYMLIAAIASFRESRTRLYNELLNLAADGIVVHEFISETARGYFTEVNPAICAMLGYTQKEMRKLTPLDVMIPEDVKRVSQDAEILIRDKVLRHTKTLLAKDGRRIPSEISTRLYEAQGRPMVLSIIRDMTERKQAEEAMAENAAQLAETNRELEEFNYSVSNDLRVPLRAIAGFSQMILKKQGDCFDEETQRRFQVIIENIEAINRLIDDLMIYSRLGRQVVAKRSLNMEELARDVWQELRPLYPEREFTLTIDKMPAASGDWSLIRQVYSNLLENAIKFTQGKNPAVIEAGSLTRDEGAVYYIRDNGIGFDMKFHDKLFGVFQRLHINKEYEGTGIGLALVQRIVSRHGGRVWAESGVDKGATFYFTLPTQQG